MRGSTAGFTLVEVLVALAVTATLLALLGNFLVGSTRAVSVADVRNEALNDVTLAQQLIASRVRQAWWVAPPGSPTGSTINLGAAPINLATPALGQNPRTGTGQWTVPSGALTTDTTHQVLMMILPPEPGVTQYRLYMYYPVLRSVLVGAYPVGSAERPLDDPANAGSWVLMQLRADLGTARPTLVPGVVNLNTAGLTFSGVTVSPLMEYQRPLATGQPLLFAYGLSGGAVQSVSINLQVSRNLRGQELRQPGDPLALTVYPRNLGR